MDSTFPPYGILIFCFFCFSLLIQLCYYLGVFSRLVFFKKKTPSSVDYPPVSVIICARNEDDNIVQFLPLILNQDYPNYQVVVVNDCSFDNTGDVLEEIARREDRLKIVTIKPDDYYSHGKKFALMVGIKGAENDLLLLTDADCKPVSNQWLKSMASNFTSEKEIVIGYGAHERSKGFLNKLIRYDGFYIALQYLSFSIAGRTYMGVGRNLAYEKELFFRKKGFASHYQILSGDDDLFVNEAATKNNVSVELDPNSFTLTRSKKTWSEWVRQKKRHVTTWPHYKPMDKFLLGLLPFAQFLFFSCFLTLLVMHYMIYVVISVFVFRFLVQMLIFNGAMRRLNEKDLLVYSPLMELILMFFYPALALSNAFQKKNKWN
ncbi:MAG TPA: glycosyltransferase [Bacteroidia bacterium]|nr:glycosyltransferase [Bacteroidia bacterium]